MASKKPNIILFITHDQGQFLSCYNSPQTPNSLKTPNLDNLAKDGIRFTNYFCTAPQCSPSRGSIQTSLYPHQNGLMGLVDRGWTLPESNKTLPMYLKENGYSTHLMGFQHESFDAYSLGYDTISKRRTEFFYNCQKMNKNYQAFFKEHQVDGNPFYLNIGLDQVHRPFRIWSGPPVDPEDVKIPPYLPDNEIVRKDLSQFYSSIQGVDECIGNILKMLEECGLRDDTLFIYTTDHGEAYPRAKCTLYDPGIKTLLLMSYPNSNILKKGNVYDQMISNIDLLPTILDLIGAYLPEKIEGKSFLPLLQGKKDKFRKEIYCEKSFHEIYDPIRCIRTERFKFIKNFEKNIDRYQIAGDMRQDELGKYFLKIVDKTRSDEELYDLEDDPIEQNNLIDNSNYKEIIKELKDKLFSWMRRTDDPLLKGKIEDRRSEPPLKF
ncbi:MAG: sulfatase [Promethearchaeota archaeon]|nr:MAG: sulfatase [Candidatus Lokiarchaeota archaeon]